MAFGILEPQHDGPVPGTAFMAGDLADLPEEYQNIPRDFFRYGTGRYSNIILIPQPSENPNDPLNWPRWRKEVILIILSLNAGVVGAFGPMIGPGFLAIAQELGVGIDTLTQSTAWTVLAIGLFLFPVSPIAKIWGRRSLFVASSAILLATSIWGALVTNYPSLLGVRVVAGLGMAPYENLVQCVIGDMYFVHERGTRIAVWNMALFAGINAGATVAGYIIEAYGFRWTFGACAIIFGILFVGVLFLCPETAFRRDNLLPVVTIDEDGQKGLRMRPRYQINLQGDDYEGRYVEISATQRKKSWRESLRLFNGRFSGSPYWKVFLRPIAMVFYPPIIWAMLTFGTGITWLVLFSVVNAGVFTLPPYNMSVSEVGLISMSPFALCTVGFAISGPLSDYMVVTLTRKNRGVYEPEFRLPLLVISVVLGVIGFFGFGLTVHYQTHWLGPVLCYGAAYMSLVFAANCVYGYILDCYRKHNAEAFVAINTRNLITFGFSYIVTPWLARDGPLKTFCTLGAIFTGCCLLTIPLWIYGKRIRYYTGRKMWLKRLMED